MTKLTRNALFALVFTAVIGSTVQAKDLIVTPYDSAKFQPMNPADPTSRQIAVVEGDFKTGASAFYLKFRAGLKGRIHNHDADYHATVVKGSVKHWAEGHESEAHPLPPGSYWFQPGKQFHGDECLGPDECVLLVVSTGKFTFGLPPEKH